MAASAQQIAQQSGRILGAAYILGAAGVCAATELLAYLARTPIIDDAYITFRYAHNLARALEFTYNTGEPPLLGVTTPLWTAIMSLFAPFGQRALEISAIVIGRVSLYLAAIIIGVHYLGSDRRDPASFLVIPVLVLFFYNHAAGFSGMETGVYILLVALSLAALNRERFLGAAVAAALAALTRPDGAIMLMIALFLCAAKRPKQLLGALLVSALVLVPWFIFAADYFGSLLPHSIAAKRAIHPAGIYENLLFVSGVLTTHTLELLVFAFGCFGLALLAKERRFLAPLCWLLLYLAGLVLSGIKPVFYWYYAPFWFFLLGFGMVGIYSAAAKRRGLGAGHAALLAACVLFVSLSLYRASEHDPAMARDAAYHEIAGRIKPLLSPQDSIYLCEIGILGYGFRENRIIDASGIVSLFPYQVRRAARDELIRRGTPSANMDYGFDWSGEIIRHEKPAWIISPRAWCQMGIVEKQPWFQELYKIREVAPIEAGSDHLGGIGIYERKLS